MALAALDEDAQRIVFVGLCNPLEPWVAVNLSSASRELRGRGDAGAAAAAERVDHEATTALCRKIKDCHSPEIWPKKTVEVVFALKA